MRINLGFISLMPEILYTKRGLTADIEDSEQLVDANIQTKTTVFYLSCPILIGLNLSKTFQVFGGPAMDFQTSNEIQVDMNVASIDTSFSSENVKEFNNFFPSAILGAGLRFGRFTVDLRFLIPLSAAYEETVESTDDFGNITSKDAEVTFSNWFLGLGYLF